MKGQFVPTASGDQVGEGSQVLKNSFLPLLSQATASNLEPMGPPLVVLRSAFRIPQVAPAISQWSRSCITVKSTFIRTKANYSFADGLCVAFNTISDVPEVIEIAKKFLSAQDEGYVGEGFTKCGIYVCQFHVVIQVSIYSIHQAGMQAHFNGREYVITQPVDSHMSSESMEALLKAEYALLCMGSCFKIEFDRYAQEQGITTIPRRKF